MEGAENVEITKQELDAMRKLDDFDLCMLVSEIHDHGWGAAKELLRLQIIATAKLSKRVN